MSKLKDYDIVEMLNGYDSEMDGLDSDDENGNELDVQAENDTFPIEELQHLMDEFNVENLEEIEFDQFEENVSYIETVNDTSSSTYHNSINKILLTEKKDIKWQRSPFPIFNLNLQPIDDVMPEVIGFDRIDPPITYFSKYYTDVDFESMVQYTNMYALQKGKPWKNTDIREIKIFFGLHIIMGCTKFPRIRIIVFTILLYLYYSGNSQ
ncbi:uncharacterized protein LOC132919030 [Rhopalosiphum padi]|uniref:uncharacterized protein LOC132919030 n=1 Tax=Rhopalosiphum padi TaxID=40932 RepID=UPI00298E3A61|nr:uncharacterized protein LOC132919030 [Rhopalosiphum padi]